MTLQIKDWQKHFEVAQSRQAKIHTWVSMPNHHDGDSYTELIEEHKNGVAHFGVWCAIVQVCSQHEAPRNGWLTKDGLKGSKPYNTRALERKTRMPQKIIEEALQRFVDIGWLIEETNSRPTADQQQTNSPLLQQDNTVQNNTLKKTAPNGAEFYNSKNGLKLWGRSLKAFKIFWKTFDYPKGRADAIDPWVKLVGNGDDIDEQLAMKIIAGAKVENSERDPSSQTPKWAQGWLMARRWEDLQPKRTQQPKPVEKPLSAEELAETETQRVEAMEVVKNLGNTMDAKGQKLG